ncbi:MAG: anaerobic ribonucleoside-triphosphate reductase activating protein [Methanosarcinaceae archaeon]|nr:anaerobic ribonucleoside-triphosphate reductase activating protein [Methanosarcinaceae archaeon]
MELNLGGTVPLSTVDWPGRSVISVFFNGCPLKCPYCHNFENINAKRYVDIKDVETEILKSKPFVSAVVFLGGEPTVQPEALVKLARFSKENKLLVGVHTNGYYPEVIERLIEEELADKFFVDIKAPLVNEKYDIVAGFPNRNKKTAERVIESIKKIDESDAALELKTTVFPKFTGNEKDIEEITKFIKENIKNKQKTTYVIQQGRTENIESEEIKKGGMYSKEEIYRLGLVGKKKLNDLDIYIRTDESGREKIGN